MHFVGSYYTSNVGTSHSKNVGLAILYSTRVHQCLSWEANSCSDSQNMSGTLWNRKVHYRVHNSSPSSLPKARNSTPNPYIMFRYKMHFNYALLYASRTLEAISYQEIFQIWISVGICIFPVSVTCSGQLIFRRCHGGEESWPSPRHCAESQKVGTPTFRKLYRGQNRSIQLNILGHLMVC